MGTVLELRRCPKYDPNLDNINADTISKFKYREKYESLDERATRFHHRYEAHLLTKANSSASIGILIELCRHFIYDSNLDKLISSHFLNHAKAFFKNENFIHGHRMNGNQVRIN